jgi:hypothetical protein
MDGRFGDGDHVVKRRGSEPTPRAAGRGDAGAGNPQREGGRIEDATIDR